MDDSDRPSDEPPRARPSDRSPASAPPAHQPAHLRIDLIDAAGLSSQNAGWLRDRLAAAAGVLACAGELRVRFVRDAEMAAAHEEYAGVEGTTDVLTFDLTGGLSAEPPEAGGEPVDADVMVCVDEAERQASERGHGIEKELLLYALHGLLHCLGHDDVDEVGFARMHAEEDRVLEAIGVGALFGAESGAESGPADDDGPGDAGSGGAGRTAP